MDFPIVDLMDTERSLACVEQHFHLEGMYYPNCRASREEARHFWINRGSGLPVYRCRQCAGVYNVYSQTVFVESQLTAAQVVLLLQGIVQGKSNKQFGRELELTEVTVLLWRHRVQAHAEALQPETALEDLKTESDEMFQSAGQS